MKKIFDFKIVVIIILIIVLSFMLISFFSNETDYQISQEYAMNNNNQEKTDSSTNTLQATSEITSGLSENVELHATYYMSECYVEENQQVKKGEKILKYTNGTYLTAPYDCVITKLNIPDEEGQCTNKHYVGVSSINNLSVKIKVDESKINNFSVGQNAKISVSAVDGKESEGYVTKISSTANNGKFTVTIEFENDGNMKIGMTASVEIEY